MFAHLLFPPPVTTQTTLCVRTYGAWTSLKNKTEPYIMFRGTAYFFLKPLLNDI